MWAGQALRRFMLDYPAMKTVLDVGSGTGEHAALMRKAGYEVEEIDWNQGDDYNKTTWPVPFDGIWCSHVLEHQLNVNSFLKKMFRDLKDDGILCVTVPPAKHEIVGGHVTLWNQGLLLYNLILAGFDCSEARVSPLYGGYNLSVIVKKKKAELPRLNYDHGDIEKLSAFWPFPASQGFNGTNINVRW
jgi:SAM-dependent methyltransferase